MTSQHAYYWRSWNVIELTVYRRKKTLISNRGRWSPLSLFRQVHLGVGKSEYNHPFSGLRAASTCEAVGFCGSHRQTDVLAKLSADDPPFAGTTAGTQPKCGNGGVSDAVTSELGDRQSSHPVKNPASVLWQVFRGVARCCLPRFKDNRSTLNTKTGYKF